jgi:hypothetical protein
VHSKHDPHAFERSYISIYKHAQVELCPQTGSVAMIREMIWTLGNLETCLAEKLIANTGLGNYNMGNLSKQSFNVIRATEVQTVTPTGQVVGVFGQDGTRGVLSILNRFGTPLFAVAEDANGHGQAILQNKEGTRIGFLEADIYGGGSLNINNKDAEKIHKDAEKIHVLGSSSLGDGLFFLYNKDGNISHTLSSDLLGGYSM